MSSDDGGHLGAMRNPESITNTVAIHNRSMDDWWETTKKSLGTSSGRSVSYSAAADGEAMGFFIIFLVVPALCVWAMMCWEAFKVSAHGGILTLTSIPLLSAAVMLVLFIWHEFED